MMYLTFALIAVLLASAAAIYRIGKKNASGEFHKEQGERNEQKARIHDRANSDAEFNERVQNRFNG